MLNPGHESKDLDDCIRLATDGTLSVIEFGCMYGDRLVQCASTMVRFGIDAHAPYIEAARRRPEAMSIPMGFMHADARDMAALLSGMEYRYDAVLMIDFIEHLTRQDAETIIADAKAIAQHRIVLFVPLGSHPQTTDVTHTGADHWQTHRSTWEPADLEALGFDVAVWNNYHTQPGKDHRAAFCIWEPK